MARSSAEPPAYQVPALEKGLDILECLASQGIPLTQTQLARALGRGPNEVFRMLVCLERRGYIQRDPGSGAYSLTLRLFELSHAHSPYQGLLRAASRPMQALTEAVRESCHLSVLQRGRLLVLAQEESPRNLRLSTEVGGTFSAINTASGRLLLAYLPQADLDDMLGHDADYARLSPAEQAALRERLRAILARGYEEAFSETAEGVRVLTVVVGAPSGTIRAALTIPALGRKQDPPSADLLSPLQRCAAEISRAAGLVSEEAGPG